MTAPFAQKTLGTSERVWLGLKQLLPPRVHQMKCGTHTGFGPTLQAIKPPCITHSLAPAGTVPFVNGHAVAG